MRLSSFFLAAVLLFSSVAFAQHQAGSTPSAPAPSAAPSPAPAAPTPAVSASAPSPTVSHSSAPSAPSAARMPESHAAPATGSTFSHVSGSTPAEAHSGGNTAPKADPERIIPDQRISGESGIVSAPRIGEKQAYKERDVKPAQPDLRHRVCNGEPCKEPAPKPEPGESDLRHPVCPNGHCPCAPGEKAGNGGCVVAAVTDPTTPCEAGSVRNGTSCRADCSVLTSQAGNLIPELRSARRDRDEACRQDPAGTLCQQLDGHYHTTWAEYQNLWAGAAPECRTTLPDPGAE